jgi:hypothetical protein
LYTPVLVLILAALARAGIRYRPALVQLHPGAAGRALRVGAICTVVATLMLSPVLYALGHRLAEENGLGSRVFWRHSPPGVDLLAFVLPNPNHPLTPQAVRDWLTPRADLYLDNVASLPFVMLAVCIVAWRRAWRPSPAWLGCTAMYVALALGPFVHVARVNTYVPGPWAVLRYAPVIGLARTPARFSVLVMVAFAGLFALALNHIGRTYPTRRRQVLCAVGVLLLIELLPVPRPIFAADIPRVYEHIAGDPRPDVRVLELPFGVRDGTLSVGNFTARSLFFQTAHHKPLVGGYLSRISARHLRRVRQDEILGTLARLSADAGLGTPVNDDVKRRAKKFVERLNIGYVVIDADRASPELIAFATGAFELQLIDRDGPFELYRPALPSRDAR